MQSSVLILGAGAHGLLTADILWDAGVRRMLFIDDDAALLGKELNGINVAGGAGLIPGYLQQGYRLIVALGSNAARKKLVEQVLPLKAGDYCNAVHPSAVIMRSAVMGTGNDVFALTYVGTNATIGNHVILNNKVVVEHDCIIEDYTSVAPGSVISGRCHIGEGAFIGVGCTVLPRIKIGKNVVVAAGSVVKKNIPDNMLVAGNPAKPVMELPPEGIWNKLL